MRLQHLCLMAAVALGGTIAAVGSRRRAGADCNYSGGSTLCSERGRRPRRFGATPGDFRSLPLHRRSHLHVLRQLGSKHLPRSHAQAQAARQPWRSRQARPPGGGGGGIGPR